MGLVINQEYKPEEIIDYLRKNPDFFIKNPKILSSLKIPHETAKNVTSLIEYQVVSLRGEISELNKSIDIYKNENDLKKKLLNYFNDIILSLLMANGFDQLNKILNQGLKNFYSAKNVALLIFTQSSLYKDRSVLKFHNQNSKLGLMFTELFHRGKPLCGSLQEEHIKVLFGQHHDSIHSTVLVPLVQPDWRGLLVIGSDKHNCYSHGFELDLLTCLSQILVLSINKQF